MQVPFLNSFLNYYKIFEKFAGRRIYLLTAVIVIGSVAEGLGIGLVIPLLTFSSTSNMQNDAISKYFYTLVNLLGITPSFNIILVSILIMFLIKALVIMAQEALTAHISSSLVKDLRHKIVSAYKDMQYTYYLNMNIGFLNNLVTNEIDRAVAAFGTYTMTIVAIIYIAIYAAAAILISWQTTLLAVVSGSMLLFTFKFLNNLSKHYSTLTSQKNSRLQQFLIQIIQYFKYLKATSSFEEIKSKLDTEIKDLAEYSFRLSLYGGILRSSKEPFIAILMVGLIFIQVSVMGKAIASIIAVLMLFYLLMTKLFHLQFMWQKFNAVVGGIDTVNKAFGEFARNIEQRGDLKVSSLNSAIRFEKVDFSFASSMILHNISLTIPKNGIVAIVGESGSGKSTIVDLMVGLMTPKSGKIYFDDVEYEKIDLENMRRSFGYVTQESVMFYDTIANNISMWKHNKNNVNCLEGVESAARRAYCHDFVMRAELGYDAAIGDRGIKMSGGQRQRLSIARELFRDPEIIIFDEATSALDSDSESYVHQTIASLKGSKTIIIIAHRLATIKNSDYIYVLHKGGIVEEGTFEELHRANTRFKTMCEAQKL